MDDMGVIATDERELKFYYSSASSIGKQALGYVKASEKEVLVIDVTKTKVTGTQWLELADLLNIPVQDLINTKHPEFVETYGDETDITDENDWLKILEKSPQVFQNPIVLIGDKALQVQTPSDIALILDKEESS